jgi:gliding motility-associated-like protein
LITPFADIATELRAAIKRIKGKGMRKLLLIAGCWLLVFNSSFGQANGDYRTTGNVTFAASSNWERYNGSAWVAAGAAPVQADNVITIRTGNTATVTADKTLDQVVVASGGVLIINAGQDFTLSNGPGTDLIVSGTIINSGILSQPGTIVFNASSTYNHNRDNGSIPNITWNASSNCNITGVTANAPNGLGQSFGNFTWNCPGQNVSDLNINQLAEDNGGAVTGDFTLASTGTGSIRLSNVTPRVLAISGDFIMSGGILNLATNTGSGTVNIGGDFNMTGGTITETGSSSGLFVFDHGGTTQNFIRTAGTISSNIGFTVNSNVTIDFGTNDYANGGGRFTLSNGATLQTANTTGVNGSIQTTLRSLSASANYTFDGTAAQVTGTYLPATVNNFTINNVNGVTLSQAITINGAYSSNGQFSTAFNINFNGTTGCGGSIAASAGTVAYSNTALNIIAGTYNGLSKSGAAGVTLCGAITVNGSLSTGGQMSTAFDLTLNGTTVCGGSINATANTVSYSNATTNVLAGTYRNLTISTGATTATLCNTITVNGNLNIENSAVLQNSGSHDIYLAGNWTDNNTADGFTEGTGEVFFNGTTQQTITKAGGTSAESFYDITLNNSNGLNLASGDLNITHQFSFAAGNITFANNSNIVYLSAGTPASLNYTSVTGSRLIGKFERRINATGTYLFPVGTSTNYNPANLVINAAPGTGSVLTEFISGAPGNSGLPINEGGVEVSDAFTDGYWSLSAKNGFSSGNHSVTLNGTGFSTAIFDITRIIKRTAGGNWGFEGTHANASGAICYRNNLTGGISSTGTHFGFGHTRSLITEQPDVQTVCLNATASFSLTATGFPPLTYQWYKAPGTLLTNDGHYGGVITSNLSIATVVPGDAGNYYCIVTDGHGSTVQSTSVLLTVNPLPVPTLAGPTPVCVGIAGNGYTTEAGMSNYLWTVSAGGTITAGGGTGNNTVTITWTTAGAKTVTVNYTNGSGCTTTSPATYNVAVDPLPTPTITGPTQVCAGVAGNVYTTESGMSNYIWTVSAGGTITAGGGTGNNTVTVTWTTTGAKTVKVNYTNGNGCTATSPATYNFTVNPLPVPAITGPAPVCVGVSGNGYTTETGMSNYIWTISAGGTITAGGGTGNNTVTITWMTTGAKTVKVNYTNGNGCTATSPTAYNVTVNPLPVPTITGPTPVCVGIAGNGYTTEAGMSNYLWTVSAGGTITAGGGTEDNTVTVAWTTTGAKTITVKYTNSNGCTASSSTTYNVPVNALPVAKAGNNGPVCAGSALNLTGGPAGMTTYSWTGPGGFTSLLQNPSVSANATLAMTGVYSLKVTNASGCTDTAITTVAINALPGVTASNNGPVCEGHALNLTGGPAGMTTYSWTGPNGFTSLLQNPSVSANSIIAMAGVYALTVTNASGCNETAATTVVINALPLVNITSSNSSMCVNDSRTLTGSPIGGTFIIIDGPGTITGNVLLATGIGNISLEYKYTDVCSNKATQSIIVNENPDAIPGPDQELKFVFETQMKAELSSSETGEWSLISGTGHMSDIHSPTTMVTELSFGENRFLWKVWNGNCEASDEVKITVYDLFVPSVITPNGDGKNDYFKISEFVGQVELIIFNRWGNEEYTNGNYLNDWDGRNNKGTELPNDTYFYILKFEDGKIKKGSVLIKR